MSAAPEVSLLIPTHNNARTIAETIESCTRQTFRDLEIMIYDEESKDATRDIINAAAARDPRIRVKGSLPHIRRFVGELVSDLLHQLGGK